MTLAERLALLPRNASQRDAALVALWHLHELAPSSVPASALRDALVDARVVKGARTANWSDVLSRAAPYVIGEKLDGRLEWSLTDSGRQYVHRLLAGGVREVQHEADALDALKLTISDLDVRDYVEEAVHCLRAGALRASIVFLWTGAVRVLHTNLLGMGVSPLNAALQKHDPKARQVSKIDDFAYIKDAVLLLAAVDLGVLDKAQKTILQSALDVRNQCGHPTKYRPGIKKVASIIEDLVGILLS
jgi:hypothetical protein